MIVHIYQSTDGDWVDVFINGNKVWGNHSDPPAIWLIQWLQDAGADIKLETAQFDPNDPNPDPELGTSFA